jgi:hypothetical protein
LVLLEKKNSSINSPIHTLTIIPEFQVVFFTKQQKKDINRFCEESAG